MGLDQMAFTKESEDKGAVEHEAIEIASWRKHNRLQGYMEKLWEAKGRPNWDGQPKPFGDFNCIPLQLTETDIEQLEAHVIQKALPETEGFFFGNDSFEWEDDDGNPMPKGSYYHQEQDVQFIAAARKALQEGKRVFYDCWY